MTQRPRGNLLYDEPPLVISPSLAAIIGLSEAIVLQQLHYWLVQASQPKASFGRMFEGNLYVYNTYPQWQEQFPFWSVPTIKRTILSLEQRELILSATLNRAGMDRTKWYSINYAKLDEIVASTRMDQIDTLDQINVTPSMKPN